MRPMMMTILLCLSPLCSLILLHSTWCCSHKCLDRLSYCIEAGRGPLASLPERTNPGLVGGEKLAVPPKVACNSLGSVFDVPRKRWNCNGLISKFERGEGELYATFVGNHEGVPRPRWVRRHPRREPLLPRLCRRFTDGEDGAEGLVLRGRIRSGQQEFCGCRS